MLVFQKILIRPHRRLFPGTLLNRGSDRNLRRRWRRSAVGHDRLTQERPAIRHPDKRPTVSRVENNVLCLLRMGGRYIDNPELDPIGAGVRKGELLAVRRPLGHARSCTRRQRDFALLAVTNLNEGDTNYAWLSRRAIGLRVDAM